MHIIEHIENKFPEILAVKIIQLASLVNYTWNLKLHNTIEWNNLSEIIWWEVGFWCRADMKTNKIRMIKATNIYIFYFRLCMRTRASYFVQQRHRQWSYSNGFSLLMKQKELHLEHRRVHERVMMQISVLTMNWDLLKIGPLAGT